MEVGDSKVCNDGEVGIMRILNIRQPGFAEPPGPSLFKAISKMRYIICKTDANSQFQIEARIKRRAGAPKNGVNLQDIRTLTWRMACKFQLSLDSASCVHEI